jgi:hypothetical protein
VATLGQLITQPDRLFTPTYNKPFLYRGVAASKLNLNDYKKGSKGFWPGFSSTSPTLQVAKNFAGPGGIIFEISLAQNSPHPNVILGKGWSNYPGEDEVLLLPYFSALVANVDKVQGYTFIHVKQNEADSPLSLKKDDSWKEKIVRSVIGEIDEEMAQVLADTIDDFNLQKYFQGQEFMKLFGKLFDEEFDQELAAHTNPDLETLSEGIEKRMLATLPGQLRHTLAGATHKSNKKNLEIFQKIESTIEFNFDIHEDHLAKLVDDIFRVIKKKSPQSKSGGSYSGDTKSQVKQTLWGVIQGNILNERSDIEQYTSELEQTYKKMVTDLRDLLKQRMYDMLNKH